MTGPDRNKNDFKPIKLQSDQAYLSLDLAQLKTNIAALVASGAPHFSKTPDHVDWEILTVQGRQSGTEPIERAPDCVDRCGEGVAQFKLTIYQRECEPHFGFAYFPTEKFTLAVDFERKRIGTWVTVVGRDRAEALHSLAMEGIRTVDIDLPDGHRYLTGFIEAALNDHGESSRNVFLAMRFTDEAPFPEIVEVIRETCAKNGLVVLRADDRAYTDDLWDNVMTYMYACRSAIAVFDQINYREFNPNVALEAGFLLAQRKRVLLLKDKAIPALPTDIVGKIYRPFDTYQSRQTIPPQIDKWVHDCGLNQ